MILRAASSESALAARLRLRDVALFLIRGYQTVISPLLPPACRFYPSCSSYMLEAIEQKGFLRGLLLGTRRLLRCHPFHPGGFDPLK